MRIYIPATSHDIASDNIGERIVHTLTPELVQAVDLQDVPAGERRDVLEAMAMNAAADDSLRRLAASIRDGESAQPRRVVIVADAPKNSIESCADSDQLPTALSLAGPLHWKHVESIHIDDDDEALDDINAAMAGDEAAFERSYEHELMWYDITERKDLIRILSAD
ncbi:MAG: hypothetical protein IKZ87_02880 [Actinomycetaceae bacterium]|nr:hypothetical protein [Actinomycetaceae bacterium]